MSAPLRLGTRGSALALAQSGQVAEQLTARTGRQVELVRIVTDGDRSTAPVAEMGGTGVFVTALREALLGNRVDLAVHSYKDLPTAPADRLTIAAVPVRADPRDALVTRDGRGLTDLTPDCRIGTGSPRRSAQLRAMLLGFDVVPVRGNVDSRLDKVRNGELDAVVLAKAGLARLGRLEVVSEVLDPLVMLPAPGQGALAIECRSSDTELLDLLAVLDDADSRIAVRAERALLATLEGGCTAPVGALAEVVEGDDGAEIYLRGLVAAPDGTDTVRHSATGQTSDPQEVGHRLAAELLDLGAADLMGDS